MNISTLVRSIDSLNFFIDGKEIIVSGNEFNKLLELIKGQLKIVGNDRQTSFYEEEIIKMPNFNSYEIDYYLRKRGGFIYVMEGKVVKLIDIIVFGIKSKGAIFRDTGDNLQTLKAINLKIIDTLNKPGMEEMYLLTRKEISN